MSLILDLNDEQIMILNTLQRASNEANAFDERLRRLRHKNPDRLALWSQLAELGALGLCLPEEAGGFGGTARDMALLPAGLGASLPVEPFLTVGITTARLLLAAGEMQLCETLVDGSAILVPALIEGADPFAEPRSVADGTGDSYRLNGTKPAVRHGDVANGFLISARMPSGQTGLFLCDAQADGLEREETQRIDDAGATTLTLRNAPARLLSSDAGAAIADALDWTLAALCVETAVICEAVNGATFSYMQERKQFGAPLARFQALQFQAADMQVAATEAAAIADAALAALEAEPGPDRQIRILQASLGADRTGKLVVHSAVQLHGGMGVSDELVISHYARRMAAVRAEIGTTEARAAQIDLLRHGKAA